MYTFFSSLQKRIRCDHLGFFNIYCSQKQETGPVIGTNSPPSATKAFFLPAHHGFSLGVNPEHAFLAVQLLKGSPLKQCRSALHHLPTVCTGVSNYMKNLYCRRNKYQYWWWTGIPPSTTCTINLTYCLCGFSQCWNVKCLSLSVVVRVAVIEMQLHVTCTV